MNKCIICGENVEEKGKYIYQDCMSETDYCGHDMIADYYDNRDLNNKEKDKNTSVGL